MTRSQPCKNLGMSTAVTRNSKDRDYEAGLGLACLGAKKDDHNGESVAGNKIKQVCRA